MLIQDCKQEYELHTHTPFGASATSMKPHPSDSTSWPPKLSLIVKNEDKIQTAILLFFIYNEIGN